MNRCSRAAWAAAVAGVLGGSLATRADVDLDRLMAGVRRSILADAPAGYVDDTANADAIVARLSPDGSWPDVDYANASRGSWPADRHVDRALQLAIAAAVAPTPVEASRLNGAAVRAVDWWRAHDLKSPNWWYNQIAVPDRLGRAAVVMGAALPAADRDYITTVVLPRSKRKMTGTNAAWLNGNLLLLGLLRRDPPLVTTSLSAIFGQAKVTDAEGIQPDFSFHQHGPQQQFGNYGLGLFTQLTHLGQAIVPAGYPLTDGQSTALRRFAFDGLQWTCWRGVMDVSACGRQLFPNSGRNKADTLNAALRAWADVSPADRPACDAAVHRTAAGAPNDLVGDRYFWRSDYGVHRRPAFMATVRMCSTRVLGCESLNSENLTGYHLATGATFFYRSGEEYENAMPLLDWRKVPGVTCPWSDGPMPTFSLSKNDSAFVGGVGDGTDSAVAFDLRRDGVSAAKAYFFLGDDVVCLGTAITATGDEPIVTTIDQFATAGPGGPASTAAHFEDHGLRYELLSPGTMSIDRREKTGAWSTVFRNGATPKGTTHGTVVTLGIDHGRRPTDASYAYGVGLADAADARAVRVLSNTAALQAVAADGRVAAVFRSAGAVRVDGRSVTVDQPCVMLTDPATHALWVADPTQKRTALHVSVDGRDAVAVPLPTGGLAGSSVAVKMNGP